MISNAVLLCLMVKVILLWLAESSYTNTFEIKLSILGSSSLFHSFQVGRIKNINDKNWRYFMSWSLVPQQSLRLSLRWVVVGSVKNTFVLKNKAQPTFTVRKVTSQSCEKVQQQDLIGELILEKAQWDV